MGSEPQNTVASPAGWPGALTLLDETSWGLFDWNLLDGTCVLSPSYKALLGYAEHELADHIGAFYALIHPDDRPLMRRDFEDNISAKDRDVRHLFRIINKSGGLRWIEGRGRVSTNEHGVPVRMFGIAFDVTAQHEARATLLAAKAFSDQVIEASLDAILAFDAHGTIIACNAALERIWRRPRAEVLGATLTQAYPFLDPRAQRLVHDALAGTPGHARDWPYRLPAAQAGEGDAHDGARHFSAAFVPLANPAGALMIVRERSMAKRMQRSRDMLIEAGIKLAQSLERPPLLEAIAELCVPVLADWCVLLVADDDSDGATDHVTGLPRSFQTHVHHPEPQLCAQLAKLAQSPAGEPCSLVDVLQRLTGGSLGGPARICTPSAAQLRALEAELPSAAALRHAGLHSLMHVPLAMRGIGMGALVLVRVYEQLRPDDLGTAEMLATRAALALENARLVDELGHTVRSRDDILAVVSHDLKNPITAMLLRSERMARRLARDQAELAQAPAAAAAAQEMAAFVGDIQRYTRTMQQLIVTVLDMAKMQGGLFRLSCSPSDAQEPVAEAVRLVRPMAEARGVQLCVDLTPQLPLVCDVPRIARVLTNLIENALKFSPAGGRVGVQVRGDAAGVRFAVADEGPGIPAASVARLFDRLWQDPRTAAQGTGLGLYIAHNIVAAHGARIEVDTSTEAPTGTTFSFTLHPDGPDAAHEAPAGARPAQPAVAP